MTMVVPPANTWATGRVAPFVLVRCSGESPELLRPLCLDQTQAVLKLADEAEKDAKGLAPIIEAACFRLVPTLDNRPKLRRAVLALKRDVHNGRMSRLGEAELLDLQGMLGESASQCLLSFLEAIAERDEQILKAMALFTRELESGESSLVGCMALTGIQQGLALASPAFLATCLKQSTKPVRPDSKFFRSAMAYLARCTVKTSPFSTFTQIGMTHFDVPGPARERVRHVDFSRSLAFAWLLACARHSELAPAFQFVPNAGIWSSEHATYMIVPDYLHQDGLFARMERVVNATPYRHAVDLVQRVGRAAYDTYCAALGGANAHLLFQRMLSTGLLRPVAPWSRTEPNPVRILGEAIAPLSSEVAQVQVALMEEAATLADRFAVAGGGDRLALLQRLRDTADRAFSALGQVPPAWLDTSGLLYESVGTTVHLPPLGERVREDLEVLSRLIRPYLFRTALYDDLIGHFIQQYGNAGVCTNVMEFLRSFMARPDSGTLITRAFEADVQAMGEPENGRTHMPVGEGASPPAATVFFQVVAADASAVQNGDYQIVVNQFNPGLGGLLARFNPLFLREGSLAAAIDRWLQEMHPAAERLEIPVFADWSSLQHGGLGQYPALHWPAELPGTDGSNGVDFRDLTLTHEPDRNTLTLRLRNGTPVAPVYLGVTPPYLFAGLLRLFFVLVDPWLLGMKLGLRTTVYQELPALKERVEFHPRQCEGRIVLRRATWRVAADAFPVQSLGESPLDYMRRAEQWRTEHGMPQEVFVSQERTGVVLDAKKRKPMWVHFGAFHSLAAVRQMVEGNVATLQVVEALPGLGGHWVLGEDGLPRASEFLALLRWDVEETP